MTEAKITADFNKHLKQLKKEYGRSFYYWKISDRFSSGKLDYMVGFMGEVAFIELKATGEEPRTLQYHEIKRLHQAGFLAVWFDSIGPAKVFVDELIKKRLKVISNKKLLK